MKEAFDNIGLFLHAPKVGNSLLFHALFCEMLEFSHDSGLEISPYPFVRIELRRVAGKQVKRKLTFKGFHKTPNLLCLVSGVAIDNEENSLLGSVDKTLDELNELVGPDRALHHHESEHALRADCRDHVESESSSRCLAAEILGASATAAAFVSAGLISVVGVFFSGSFSFSSSEISEIFFEVIYVAIYILTYFPLLQATALSVH
jgi:hypothetical protein